MCALVLLCLQTPSRSHWRTKDGELTTPLSHSRSIPFYVYGNRFYHMTRRQRSHEIARRLPKSLHDLRLRQYFMQCPIMKTTAPLKHQQSVAPRQCLQLTTSRICSRLPWLQFWASWPIETRMWPQCSWTGTTNPYVEVDKTASAEEHGKYADMDAD